MEGVSQLQKQEQSYTRPQDPLQQADLEAQAKFSMINSLQQPRSARIVSGGWLPGGLPVWGGGLCRPHLGLPLIVGPAEEGIPVNYSPATLLGWRRRPVGIECLNCS